MSIDVSTLGIEVKSSGIKTAANQLDKLTVSAEKVEIACKKAVDQIEKLTGSVSSLAKAQSSATQAATMQIHSLQNGTKAMQAMQASSASTGKAMQTLQHQTTEAGNALGHAHHKGNILNNTLKSMIVAASAYLSLNMAGGILDAADAWGMAQARLKIVTGSLEDAKQAQSELFDMAQKYRAPLEDMTRLYTRLTPALQKMGKSSQESREMVEGVSLALKLQGATAAEASSTMLQFSQAANAGRLNGAEFNAVSENGTLILRALEQHLGKTRGELKKMGSDGVLTFDLINDAIQKALPQWRKDFEELPLTVEGSIQRIKNAWLKAIGESGQETQLGKKIAEALGKLETMIPVIADKLVTAFNFIVDHGDKVAFVISTIIGMKLASWAFSSGAALLTLAGNLKNVSTAAPVVATGFGGMGMAAKTATAGTGLLRAGMALLGGPIGLTITGISGLVAAYQLWGDKAPAASAAVTEKTGVDTEKRIQSIQKEITKLLERNGLIEKGVPQSDALAGPSMTTKAKELLETINKLEKARSNPKLNQAAREGLSISIAQRKVELDKVRAEEISMGLTIRAIQEKKKQEDIEKKIGEFGEKYAYASEKMTGEIKLWKSALGDAFTPEMEQRIRKVYDARIGKENKLSDTVKAAHKEQQAANGEIDKSIIAYKEAAAALENLQKFGIKGDKRTEAQKQQIELEEKLRGATDSGAIAKLKDALATNKATQEIEKNSLALKKNLEGQESLAAARLVLQAELDAQSSEYGQILNSAGMSDAELKYQQGAAQITQKYLDQKKRLSVENTNSPIANYEEQLAQIDSFHQRSLDSYEDFYKKRMKQDEDWSIGAKNALNNYLESGRDISSQTEQAFSNAFKGMEDAMVNFVMTGKANFKDLAKSIITDLVRIQVRQAMTGGGKGGGGANWLGTAASAIGALAGGWGSWGVANAGIASQVGGFSALAGSFAKGGAFSGGNEVTRFASGSAFTNGVVDKPTRFNIGEMGEAGPEAIMPLARGADGSLGVKSNGEGGKSVVISPSYNINIDSRTDRAEIMRDVQKALQNSNAKLEDDLKRKRMI